MRRARLLWALSAPALMVAAGVLVSILPRGLAPAHAATTTVNIGDNFYTNAPSTTGNCGSPCVTSIGVGDTVHWAWTGSNNHTTTSDNGSAESWDSSPSRSSGTFDHTFNSPGTFAYHCEVHSTMHGMIQVGPTPTNTSTPTPTGGAASPTPTMTPPGATPTSTPVVTNTNTPPLPTSDTVTPTNTQPMATDTPTMTPPAGLVGDANKDGTVNSIDAALVLQYSAGLISSINPHADANEDGTTNAIDATLILQYAAGLITHLPP